MKKFSEWPLWGKIGSVLAALGAFGTFMGFYIDHEWPRPHMISEAKAEHGALEKKHNVLEKKHSVLENKIESGDSTNREELLKALVLAQANHQAILIQEYQAYAKEIEHLEHQMQQKPNDQSLRDIRRTYVNELNRRANELENKYNVKLPRKQ